MRVIDALRSLPPGPQAVMAYNQDGFTGPEIADLLGITQQQVRDRLKKARKILRRRLRAPGQDEEAGS